MFYSILCTLLLALLGGSALALESNREVVFADPSKKTEGKRGKITAMELQEDLQRFASTFIARVYLAFQPQKGKVSPEVFHTLQSEGLFYASAALDIATGPNPESNLLDMMAFMTLTRQSLEEHWLPKVYGKGGREALQVFRKSEAEIWDIAAKVSTQEQRRVFMEIVRDWKQENPGLQRTETIRLAGIYLISGQAGSERSKKVSGILGQIQSVVASTDQAVLLTNRALFLAQKAPFLLRLHAKIGAREVVADAIEELAKSDKLIQGAQKIHPLVKDLTALTRSSNQAAKHLEGISKEMTLEKLTIMDRIVTNTKLTTESLLKTDTEKSTGVIIEIRKQVERIIYVCLVSVLVIIVVWWLGYVWAKRILQKKRE